ncbi:hypothetical protein [Rhizobium sp. F40D2]|uniref:hypothetical protein n=1 Tax=Rhizobium sp. F40D2 TaxID=3453141 RepID=UPI003F229936
MLKKRADAQVAIFLAAQHFPAAAEADRLAALRPFLQTEARLAETNYKGRRSAAAIYRDICS